jgi:glycosyltransferase involved in cell wall biosynthesis
MRILFIHAAIESSAEYRVHRTLTDHVDPNKVETHFIWQASVNASTGMSPDHIRYDRDIFYDFGRAQYITPRPSQMRRASMMLQQLPGAVKMLLTQVKKLQPDIIYTSQQKYDIQLARIVCSIYRLPHIIHVHYPIGPWLGKDVLRTIQANPRIIVVSEFIRQTALLRGVAGDHVKTLLNAAPITEFEHLINDGALRAEFHWQDTTPLVVAAGRLDPSKGHLLLFDAFTHVVRQMPTARLLVCGTSTTRDNWSDLLRKRVTDLGLDSFVTFAGSRTDIPRVLSNANVFCLPTELDACPLVFLEAMAAGIPAVACFSGGVPELVVDQLTGLLSTPGDATELANNLLLLLQDQDMAIRFGRAAKQRASDKFAPTQVAARWFEIVQNMLPA